MMAGQKGYCMRYYSTQRPLGPGTFPKQDGSETVTNFDGKIYCEEIGRDAWGFVEYKTPISEEAARSYELKGWRSYQVTRRAFEKLKEQYPIAMESLLD